MYPLPYAGQLLIMCAVLLFVLWYCHKRGKEVRLENERIVTEQEIQKMNEEFASGERQIRATETLTTTAPRGASADAIRDGVKEVEQARESEQEPAEAEVENDNGDGDGNDPAAVPTRTKSKLWSRSNKEKVEPYPGT